MGVNLNHIIDKATNGISLIITGGGDKPTQEVIAESEQSIDALNYLITELEKLIDRKSKVE